MTAVIFYLAVGWFLFYGPRVLFHQPRLINPADVLKERDRQLTYLDMPKDISKNLPRKPSNVISDKDRMIDPKLQAAMAHTIGATVSHANTSHLPMFKDPQAVADAIIAAATKVRKAQ